MDAVYRGYNWTARQLVAVLVVALAAALLAGGLGGYLVRGIANLSYQSSTASSAVARSASGPLSQPHDVAARSRSDISANTGITAPTVPGVGPLFTEAHDTSTAAVSSVGPLFSESHDISTPAGSSAGPLFSEPHDNGR